MLDRKQRIDQELYERRIHLKEFYSQKQGILELHNLIVRSGVLSELEEGDTALHNYAIRKLEEIGLLDEEGLDDLIIFMLKQASSKRPPETKEGEN